MAFLMVGLGNVGNQYADTRHNAGFWFVQALCDRYRISLSTDKKFVGKVGRVVIEGKEVRLLLPDTLMNLSGRSVAPMVKFYGIHPDKLIVAHDDLDIDCGVIKLKTGGGHGGHNGLRDIMPHTGANFHRLRIGIGRPEQGSVSSFVLAKATSNERMLIDEAIDHALDNLPLLLENTEKSRSFINGYKKR